MKKLIYYSTVMLLIFCLCSCGKKEEENITIPDTIVEETPTIVENINTETITTMTEANQNFSKVAKVAENNGQAVIFKNNKPKFLLIDVDSNSYFDITDDEKIDVAAKRIMNRFKPAFEELAK